MNVMFIEGNQFVNESMVARETKKDSVLSKVLHMVGPRNPNHCFILIITRDWK